MNRMFFVRRCNVSILLCREDYLLGAFRGESQVVSVYSDYSNAFDSINFNLLIEKPKAVEILIHVTSEFTT